LRSASLRGARAGYGDGDVDQEPGGEGVEVESEDAGEEVSEA
jgi:hypothetical protein